MGAVPAPVGQTCVFHAERTEQINEMSACVRMVESRLGDMAARMAVANEIMATIQRDLDSAHRNIREHRAAVSDQLRELGQRLEQIAEVGAVTRRNAERLDHVEKTLEKVDGRLRDIEEIAARRQGIDEDVADLKEFAARADASLRTIRWMFGALLALIPSVSALVGWMMTHAHR